MCVILLVAIHQSNLIENLKIIDGRELIHFFMGPVV